MENINISQIQRNCNDFNFVETLGSFIHNSKFGKGFENYQQGKNGKDTYLWKALSAIGEQEGEIIYENVLNYINNASNIDLCKVKALQSMIDIVGMNYEILPMFNTIPVEIANLIDILSINRKYLLDSKTFKQEFIDMLSANHCIITGQPSDDVAALNLSGDIEITEKLEYIDESAYVDFLKKIYSQVLNHFIFLQYADAENSLSTSNLYIYEYIQDDLIADQANANEIQQSAYDAKMTQLKIQYCVGKDFDQSGIVDAIEYGYDSINNYNTFQQIILSTEIQHRKDTYQYDKTYLSSESDLGYNLTRYSYYRERKVKEYFAFVEDTYNSLLTEETVKNAVDNTDDDVSITSYDKDKNYFNIDIKEWKHLLVFNELDNEIEIQHSYIESIAELLANSTIEIANIRDQVKLSIRKAYMRGTWLLMSYIINEYLKYDICDKYGKAFQTEDGIYLESILSASLSEEGNRNTRLIEYYDPTEYFNITHDSLDEYALNGDTTNYKFWDNINNKIGEHTKDIPLDEIDYFYKEQLKLKHNHNVDNLIEFLSTIYEYGSNNSYIDKDTGNYVASIPNSKFGENPIYVNGANETIKSYEQSILSIDTFKDKINDYIDNGYQLPTGWLSSQLNDISSYMFTYISSQIIEHNENLIQEFNDSYDENKNTLNDYSNALNNISSLYVDLVNNTQYSPYFKLSANKQFFGDKLSYTALSISNANNWKIPNSILNTYQSIVTAYNDLKIKLSNLIDLSVKVNGYWLAYEPPFNSEITTITDNLKTYLIEQWPTATESQKNRISCINNTTSAEYNIKYFETKYLSSQNEIQKLLTTNSLYFSDYINSYSGQVNQQLVDISSYIDKHNAECSSNALNEVTNIKSQYDIELQKCIAFSQALTKNVVTSITDDYLYRISSTTYGTEIWPKINATQHYNLDYILSGNNFNQKLSGVIYWLSDAYEAKLNESINSQINLSIQHFDEYVQTSKLINAISSDYSNLISDDSSQLLITKLDNMNSELSILETNIDNNLDHYNKSREIYIKYNGTEIGYDPFYNYKNQAYSSYQIHPYLYNFIEKSNVVYPLAQAFFVAFTEEYEKELYEKGIDNIIGQYGNIKNAWKSGLFDWTSYQTTYESYTSKTESNVNDINPIDGFVGLFYPPALEALLNNREQFLQDVQDNTPNSYYYHLNFSNNQCQKTYEQLMAYEQIIKYVATAQETNQLSGEFDIYRYVEDCMGNQIFLLKSYKHLYEAHANDSTYTPSYHDKRNAFGEIWMRPKNHPLAFPAFDLREGYEDLSLYSIKKKHNSYAKDINRYIIKINDVLRRHEEYSEETYQRETAQLTRDTIYWHDCEMSSDQNLDQKDPQDAQHLRCFYDFEIDTLKRALLVVVPFNIGLGFDNTYKYISLDARTLRYADSSIVIGYLGKSTLFNSNSDQTYVYNFTSDTYADCIENPNALINGQIINKHSSIFYEFLGFAKRINLTYAIFIQKYLTNENHDPNHSPVYRFSLTSNISKTIKPTVTLQYSAYKEAMSIIKGTTTSSPIKYDCYDWHSDDNKSKAISNKNDYHNASNVALAGNGTESITIAFLTERIGPAKEQPNKSKDYVNGNCKIVNYAEYPSQVEQYGNIDDYGKNLDYPRSTALIQTTDSQHINIYNSFDSFSQYVTMLDFQFVGSQPRHKQTRYYNLNSDIGFLPQYVDECGQTHYCNNRTLSGQQYFDIELLGPEKSDIAFSPVIHITTDEKYGRVTEDYRDFTKISANNDSNIVIKKLSAMAAYEFSLSDMYVANLSNSIGLERAKSTYEEMRETNQLLTYKYILYNSKYLAMPILKGDLSSSRNTGYYYLSSEKYDLLSGEDILGPNMKTYQNINMTNHINNISAIDMNIIFDEENAIPSALNLNLYVRAPNPDEDMVIEPNNFYLLIYTKNNIRSYQYYHIFENPNSNLKAIPSAQISTYQTYAIDLSKPYVDLSALSVESPYHSTVYPFRAINKTDDTPPSQLSAPLEFKYSENDPIHEEFPTLDVVDVEDEITIVDNNTQSIYFFQVDDYSSLDLEAFEMRVFVPAWNTNNNRAYSYNKKINPVLLKYKDFFTRSLMIEATYNMEQTEDSSLDDPKYEIVEYFNYKNFTNPQYVNINWHSTNLDDQTPPEAYTYDSSDDAIKHTYLVLKPGQTGRLDIMMNFVEYNKLDRNSINQSVVGSYSKVIMSYYIMNVSDNKPKFRIQRMPFSIVELTEDTDNYEIIP